MQRARPSPEQDSSLRARLIVLLCAVLLSAVAGTFGIGASFEATLRAMRDITRSHKASGDIVIAGIDDKSMAQIGSWPWPRATYALLSDKLRAAGARRIVFDIAFDSPSNPHDDAMLATALARWKTPPVLAVRSYINSQTSAPVEDKPMPMFRRHATLANVSTSYSLLSGTVTELPYALRSGGTVRPSFAAELAGLPNAARLEGKTFPIDFSVRESTIPIISIVDVLNDKVDRRLLAGRQVIIAGVSIQLNDVYFAPGRGLTPGAMFHALGAETLKRGRPSDLGWMFPLIVALLLCAWPVRRGGNAAVLAPPLVLAIALVIPFLLDHLLVFVHIVPTLLALSIAGGGWGWLRLRHSLRTRGTTNLVSGLPNLEALRKESGTATVLIAARIRNFSELSAALSRPQEKLLVEQIAARLRLGLPTRLYQGDEGIFAWLAGDEHGEGIGEHLDALHSLFRSPAAVDGRLYDIGVTFGVDGATDRSLANRLGSALIAADEAAAEGARWKLYDVERSKDSAWKLSLLSQLDAAIDDGGLWIAYQPKLDLATNAIVGAEALVRWTHPEKGPISPDEFIKAAEQSNRIERLTAHVLDRAIAAAAAINGRGRRFGIAVNLSARLLGGDAILGTIADALARHELPPGLLTLEVTETAMLVDDPSVAARLVRLRDTGVQLSVDDYGTGLSTLEYLKMIPASEIKIDKSFVQTMTRNANDEVIVRSTIELAHSLGRKVVAEGVEEAETLEALRDMRCDLVQGYLISRPVAFSALVERLFGQDAQRAA